MEFHENFYSNDEPSNQVNPDQWTKIRANVYKRDGGICQVCLQSIACSAQQYNPNGQLLLTTRIGKNKNPIILSLN